MRNPGGILDETFAVYGGQIWRYMGLVAVARAPLAVAAFVLGMLVKGTAGLIVDIVIGAFGAVAIYAACAWAVGQQYVSGKFDLWACYSKVWWRAVSLGGLGLAAAVSAVGTVWLVVAPPQETALMVLVLSWVMAAALCIVGVYLWPTAVQAVVVERRRTLGAVRRGFSLVAGSWWRLGTVAAMVGLVILGLTILITLPFVTLVLMVAGDQNLNVARLLYALSGEVMQVVVMPVLFIAGTLTYYDLRVRKEHYDIETLSREMGAAAA